MPAQAVEAAAPMHAGTNPPLVSEPQPGPSGCLVSVSLLMSVSRPRVAVHDSDRVRASPRRVFIDRPCCCQSIDGCTVPPVRSRNRGPNHTHTSPLFPSVQSPTLPTAVPSTLYLDLDSDPVSPRGSVLSCPSPFPTRAGATRTQPGSPRPCTSPSAVRQLSNPCVWLPQDQGCCQTRGVQQDTLRTCPPGPVLVLVVRDRVSRNDHMPPCLQPLRTCRCPNTINKQAPGQIQPCPPG